MPKNMFCFIFSKIETVLVDENKSFHDFYWFFSICLLEFVYVQRYRAILDIKDTSVIWSCYSLDIRLNLKFKSVSFITVTRS